LFGGGLRVRDKIDVEIREDINFLVLLGELGGGMRVPASIVIFVGTVVGMVTARVRAVAVAVIWSRLVKRTAKRALVELVYSLAQSHIGASQFL
jgi:hypothetical protein